MDEVIIVPYDPRWPQLFDEEAARINTALGDLVLEVAHFGSTAIPGLSAKPIIDLLVGVRSLAEAKVRAVPALEDMGYSYWRDNPAPAPLFLVKGLPPNGPRTHHIHIVERDAPDPKNNGCLFSDRLRFRDYLRLHPDERQRYEDLKQNLAVRFKSDREAYTDAKGDYVRAVMEKANAQEA